MNLWLLLLLAILVCIFWVYGLFYFFLSQSIKKIEHDIIALFHLKVGKIPALIEIMRPSVVDETAFDTITALHTENMIYSYRSVYDVLEHNARIHNEFLFLLKLSVHMPDLHTKPYFVYLRDFIIRYDRDMQAYFWSYNEQVTKWNRFVFCKNVTLIGYFLPGATRASI